MDVDAINSWSEGRGMPLNDSKCVHTTYGKESTFTYGFNTPDKFAAMPTKDGIKDLGVTFTSNLKFSRYHERKLFKPRAGSSIRLHFYSCRIVESWNNLPREVVCAPSKDSFKRRLDKYLGINN